MAIPYRPYERRTLENLLAGVQAGMDPALGYSIFSDTQGGALDRLAQQRGVRQDRRLMRQDALSGFGDTLTQAALGGVPAQGLDALAGLQMGANPMLQNAVGGGLDSLLGNAGQLSASLPVDPETAGGITPDEQSAILSTASDALDAAAETGTTDFQSVFWGGLARTLTQAGFVGADFEQAKQLVKEVWERLGGTFAEPSPSAGPTPAPTRPSYVGGGGGGAWG